MKFIPVQNGQLELLGSQAMLNDLLGNIGYEVVGKKVLFHKDITLDGVTSINAQLAVTDTSLVSNYDVLPISADMEMNVITNLVKLFSTVGQKDEVVDNFTEPTKQAKQ